MSCLTWRRMVWVCALAAISSSLYAVDGVILIDQNHALAGNVTPGDAPGFPVTISQPGSYRLSGNLTVPDVNTTAIQITVDNVTLDLNGFSIIGPNVCTFDGGACPQANGVGVQAGVLGTPGPRGVRVLNGTVRGMGSHGIFVNGAASAVEKVVALSNRLFGIEAEAGSVIDSVASFNSTGIVAKTVLRSTAEGNSQIGIEVSVNGLAADNVANSNAITGIQLDGGDTATGNTTNHNNGGIIAECPSTIVGNTAFGNPFHNILVQQAANAVCTLANNSQ
jgi:hypothetical protein